MATAFPQSGHDHKFTDLSFRPFRFSKKSRSSQESSMELQTDGVRKYSPTSGLLASSAGLGWSTLSVELRSHNVSEAPAIVPQHVEICLVIAGNKEGLVKRTGAGFSQEAIPKTGAIWLSPAGVGKEIAITAPIPQTMHLYLPPTLFDRLNDGFKLPVAPAYSIRHAAGIGDDLIHEIGSSILSELTTETAASRVYVETASLTLAARLLQKYCDSGECASTESSPHSLDHIRLRRVLEYIAANIGGDISLVKLADIAGYSTFHFARKFTVAMGVPPHRYISRVRLEKAMAELAAGKLPLAEIALNAQFSSQASFTRAFHRATGMTPKEYQRRRR
jgi:AraC family transcriptional regulator